MRNALLLLLCLTSLGWAQTQRDLDEKAGVEYKQADATLNRVYNELLGKLQGTEKQKLVAAELEWIKFRGLDAEARSEANRGGTIHSMIYTLARTRTTRDRTAQLKEWLDELKELGN